MSKAKAILDMFEDDEMPAADTAAMDAPPADPAAAPGAPGEDGEPRMHKYAELGNDMNSLKSEVEDLMGKFQMEDPMLEPAAHALQKRIALILGKLDQMNKENPEQNPNA